MSNFITVNKFKKALPKLKLVILHAAEDLNEYFELTQGRTTSNCRR